MALGLLFSGYRIIHETARDGIAWLLHVPYVTLRYSSDTLNGMS